MGLGLRLKWNRLNRDRSSQWVDPLSRCRTLWRGAMASAPVGKARRALGRVLRPLRDQAAGFRLQRDWDRLATTLVARQTPGTVRRLVILPADPHTPVGSKGDEAMMRAVIARIAASAPGLRVGVITASAGTAGYETLPVWRDPWRLQNVKAALLEFDADTLLVVGADVLDGYYSPRLSMRMLAVADMAAHMGLRTRILGFSFNAAPSRRLRPMFDRLSPALTINLRDPVSLARFNAFCRTPATLVADAAFMLAAEQESPRVAAVAAWVAQRRAAGDRVIVFNLHPLLVRPADPGKLQALVDSACVALASLMRLRGLSVVLLPHDDRGEIGDDVCLLPVYRRLRREFGACMHHPPEQMAAAELKAAAGLMDGVVTGRMHLAIASLGMGVPVAAVTYQDKFHGLFAHFDLPASLLLSAEDAVHPDRLLAMMTAFVDRLEPLAAQVRAALPGVMAASERNLDGLI